MRAVVCAGTLIAALAPSPFAASQVGAVQAARGFDVVDYTARLEPRIAEKTFTGRETIRLRILQPDHASVTLDSGALVIDAVREDGRVLRFAQSGGHVSIDLPRAAAVGDSHAIEFDYHGTASSGLVFVPERSQVYTSFATNQWLVSVSAPDERATIGLSVAVPAGLTVVAGGRPVSRRDAGGGLAVHEWRQDRPMPAYTFGFAAGPFSESMAEVGGHTLRALGFGFSDAELQRLLGATADAVHFFEERSGVPYGDASYTQVLVAQTAGQEMTGYSILSEAYGRALLADERVVSLAAHELAHQWWGNGVTNRAWTHFWLNEGFATFMADAYIEQRFGREAYLAAIATSRERYEKVRDAGHDRPLVFPDWDKPTADDRTLPYHKGAYLLHLLRDELGERQFWDGIRQYTRAYTGRSVTTQEFERSMEMSSGRNLAAFFDPWFR